MAQTLTEISWIYAAPLWQSGLLILSFLLLAVEAGVRTGARTSRLNRKAGPIARSDVTVNALLALLGLLLAFTYAFGLSRYDFRKSAVIDEASAIGTAFLRTDLLSEPGRTELRKLLLAYTKTRVVSAELVRKPRDLKRTIQKSLEVQAKLWPTAVASLPDDGGALEATALVSINKVLDVHNQRIVAGFDYIPKTVLALLVLVSATSLAVAGHNAAMQGNRSRWRLMTFSVILTALILIIMDIDTPQTGFVRINVAVFVDLIADMEATIDLQPGTSPSGRER